MKPSEFEEFTQLLTAIAELYGKTLSEWAQSLYWNALQQYDLGIVREALNRHVKNPDSGQFMPKPADVVRMMMLSDGRPSADELWPSMPLSEAQSVVWTAEAKTAFFVALPLIESGDLIAARMSFRAAYETACSEARVAQRPLQWEVSLGYDRIHRETTLRCAVEQGKISADHAAHFLPQAEIQLALPDHSKFSPEEMARNRERIGAILNLIGKPNASAVDAQ